jgi:hypothetical protein
VYDLSKGRSVGIVRLRTKGHGVYELSKQQFVRTWPSELYASVLISMRGTR